MKGANSPWKASDDTEPHVPALLLHQQTFTQLSKSFLNILIDSEMKD